MNSYPIKFKKTTCSAGQIVIDNEKKYTIDDILEGCNNGTMKVQDDIIGIFEPEGDVLIERVARFTNMTEGLPEHTYSSFKQIKRKF